MDYESCQFGAKAATIHPIRYLIDANGLVVQENTVLILAEQGCVLTLPAVRNQSLATVKFDNRGGPLVPFGGMLLLWQLRNITSSGVKGPFGICEYPEESKGKLDGTIHLTLLGDGGILSPPSTLRWDP
jgi:hypothetical protein